MVNALYTIVHIEWCVFTETYNPELLSFLFDKRTLELVRIFNFNILITHSYQQSRKMSSIFSSNSEANASELLENLEEANDCENASDQFKWSRLALENTALQYHHTWINFNLLSQGYVRKKEKKHRLIDTFVNI